MVRWVMTYLPAASCQTGGPVCCATGQLREDMEHRGKGGRVVDARGGAEP